jgi:hypothetical protein
LCSGVSLRIHYDVRSRDKPHMGQEINTLDLDFCHQPLCNHWYNLVLAGTCFRLCSKHHAMSLFPLIRHIHLISALPEVCFGLKARPHCVLTNVNQSSCVRWIWVGDLLNQLQFLAAACECYYSMLTLLYLSLKFIDFDSILRNESICTMQSK